MNNDGGNRGYFNKQGDGVFTPFYETDPVYGLIPSDSNLSERSWTDISSIYDALLDSGDIYPTNLTNNAYLRHEVDGSNPVDHWESVQARITQVAGLNQFSLLAQGTGTVVLLGRGDERLEVLRIHAHPETKRGQSGDYKNDCVRPPFPGLLQGLREPMDVEGVMRIEFLPLAKVITVPGGEKNEINQVLSDLTQDTCFDVALAEAAVLPDATLLAVDPGDCKYVESFWELNEADRVKEVSRSLALIEHRYQTMDIPDKLQWFDLSGHPKQDRSFSNQNIIKDHHYTLEAE
ncbi:MAG: hypothetical protein ACRBDL_02585 [Alphaproteobacteria bacterium]